MAGLVVLSAGGYATPRIVMCLKALMPELRILFLFNLSPKGQRVYFCVLVIKGC